MIFYRKIPTLVACGDQIFVKNPSRSRVLPVCALDNG